MGKRFNTEIKQSKKKEKVIPGKKRRCSSKQFGKNQNSEKNTVKTNKKASKLFPKLKPTILDLINSLDGPIKKSELYKDSNFKIDFPYDMKHFDFEALFLKGINYSKYYFKKNNLKILKIILLILKDINGKNSNDEFGLKTCVNGLQKLYRTDLIFTLLDNEKKIELLGQNDLSQVENEFKESIDYAIYIDNNSFKNCFLYNKNNNNKKEIYPFKKFKDIMTSPLVLKAYQEVLAELYNVKKTENEIMKLINDFLKKHSIYFLSMNYKHFGMTLFDGTIVINQIYYGPTYTEEFAFIILWTLLHEIMCILSRLLKGDNNFFIDTAKFTKSNQKESEENGEYFENKLLLNILGNKYLTSFEADYLLDIKNYQYKTLKQFKNAFINFRSHNKIKIQNSNYFAIRREKDEKSFSINIGCYCAGERKRMNNN